MNNLKYILSAGMMTSALAFASSDVSLGQNLSSSATTAQDFSKCPANFYVGQAPKLTNNKLAKQTYQLCFDGFAVLYSGVSRTPIWSAEHLTKKRIKDAKTLVREDSFHVESRLPHEARAQLSDYSRSGFDRGHLAPNGDMANKSQQFDSFSLANIAPQNGTHNRNIWRMIEGTTRYLTNKYGEIYVVTGVAFISEKGKGKTNTLQTIGTGVLVPSHFFKAIYIPSLNQAGVYYSPNQENGDYQVISLDELNQKTGVMAIPTLSADVKKTAFALPNPNQKDNTSSTTKQEKTDSQSGWVLLLVEILKFFVSFLGK